MPLKLKPFIPRQLHHSRGTAKPSTNPTPAPEEHSRNPSGGLPGSVPNGEDQATHTPLMQTEALAHALSVNVISPPPESRAKGLSDTQVVAASIATPSTVTSRAAATDHIHVASSPTTRDNALQACKSTFVALRWITSLTHVPGLAGVAGLAIQFLAFAMTKDDNDGNAKDLAERISGLIIMIDNISRRNPEDIRGPGVFHDEVVKLKIALDDLKNLCAEYAFLIVLKKHGFVYSWTEKLAGVNKQVDMVMEQLTKQHRTAFNVTLQTFKKQSSPILTELKAFREDACLAPKWGVMY